MEKIIVTDNQKDWKKELEILLKDFDIPKNRKEDFHWILRNIGIHNSKNPNLGKVIFCAKVLRANSV